MINIGIPIEGACNNERIIEQGSEPNNISEWFSD
jgi:hypothetical protein